ncbi:ribosomal L28 family-domain-containing protein [Phaeosphaeriaceae sp. PMI808]|nr:ribosomal L28 family-domain-containing protein [Phaeosphaeriaceae sp. PMI808]
MQPRCQLLSVRLATSQALLHATQSASRQYTTSASASTLEVGGDLGSHLPKHVIPQDAYIPPYPYGDHALFKQANRGLYGEQRIQFGNNVSHKTETKTRRDWKPNILNKALYSVALKKKVKLRITSKVLKIMDREGGLDEYLLKDNEHRIKELGPLGWALRWALLQKPEVIDRMRFQAAELGIDQATIDAQWPTQEILGKQNIAQKGYVRARDLIADEYEQDDMNSMDGEEFTKAERATIRAARKEYPKALNAAQRYVTRGLVDDKESALKLAFIRVRERQEAGARLERNFAKKLDQRFSPKDIEELKTRFNLPPNMPALAVKKIAYNQWRRGEVEKAGTYEAWMANVAAEKAKEREARLQESGEVIDFSRARENRKAMYAKIIQEAETAETNETLDPEWRAYLQTAVRKADWAIEASAAAGVDDYERLPRVRGRR